MNGLNEQFFTDITRHGFFPRMCLRAYFKLLSPKDFLQLYEKYDFHVISTKNYSMRAASYNTHANTLGRKIVTV